MGKGRVSLQSFSSDAVAVRLYVYRCSVSLLNIPASLSPPPPAPSHPQVSPGKTPQVVGALLDAEAAEEFITNLILSVRSLLPVDKVRHKLVGGSRLQTRGGQMWWCTQAVWPLELSASHPPSRSPHPTPSKLLSCSVSPRPVPSRLTPPPPLPAGGGGGEASPPEAAHPLPGAPHQRGFHRPTRPQCAG